jgi:hypothetical protein
MVFVIHIPSWSCSQAVSKPVWHIPLLCVQWKTDDGQRNCPKHVEFHSKKKIEKLVHLVCFIIRNLSRCTVTRTSNITYVSPSQQIRRQLRQGNLRGECLIHRVKHSTQRHLPTDACHCYVRQYMPSNRFLWASFLSAHSGSPASIKHASVHVRISSIPARRKHASACRMVHVIPEFAQYTSYVKTAQGAYLFGHAVSNCATMYCRHTNLLSTCLLVFEYVIHKSSQYVFWIQ